MDEYSISNNFAEIVSGTSSITAPMYIEASKGMDTGDTKALAKLKVFVDSIEKISASGKASDERITKSAGNIDDFGSRDNIVTILAYGKNSLRNPRNLNELNKIFETLQNCKAQYMEGYKKNVRLVMLEYESAVYMLVTGLNLMMCTAVDITQKKPSIFSTRKDTHGVIDKTIKDLANQIGKRDHKEYLEAIIMSASSGSVDQYGAEHAMYTEGVGDLVGDIINIVTSVPKIASAAWRTLKTTASTVIRTVFGIVPLIRTCVYFHYKRKVDHIQKLEEQAAYLKLNMEYLKNRTNLDPVEKEKILKKQQAYVDAYTKQAEQLRAQLLQEEKETAVALNTEQPAIQNANTDDFVLEQFGFKQPDI